MFGVTSPRHLNLGWVGGWVDELMGEGMGRRMDGWRSGLVYKEINSSGGGVMDGRMDG